MNKLINGEKRQISPYRWIPKQIMEMLYLKEGEHNSLSLKCGLHTVTTFQKAQCRGDGEE